MSGEPEPGRNKQRARNSKEQCGEWAMWGNLISQVIGKSKSDGNPHEPALIASVKIAGHIVTCDIAAASDMMERCQEPIHGQTPAYDRARREHDRRNRMAGNRVDHKVFTLSSKYTDSTCK